MRVSQPKSTSTNGAVVSTKVGDPKVTTAELQAATPAPKATRKPRTPKATPKVQPKAAPKAEVDRHGLAKKAPTTLHENFAQWLTEQTGVVVDLKTVQLCASLRHDFQRSAANQAELATRRAAGSKAKVERDAAKKAKFLADAKAYGLTFSSK